jgi:UDP-N-acetylglucosamine acyltransferase
VELGRARSRLARARGTALAADQTVAEADLLLSVEPGAASVHPSANVHPAARIGDGTVVGAHVTIGPEVTIGRRCRIDASVVIDGWTEIGDDTRIYPMASIGLAPQDLKYKGERTRLTIGRGNTFREFVTINRGTLGGGGHTTIGDHNLFMAYAHVAHDCHIGNEAIFANGATLGGHVTVEDFATISAYSGVHQFCRVGRHAYVGGYSVITKDALPFGKSVGNRARIYGLNTIGLVRRGFTDDTIAQLKRAYRYLLQSKLNTSRALVQIEQDAALTSPEVRYLVDFIRSSRRGVILRRPTRRAEERSSWTSWSGIVDAHRADRWQRPLPVSRARRRAGAGARRHDRRSQGRDVPGPHRRGRSTWRRDPLDFTGPARRLRPRAGAVRGDARRHGRPGQAHENLLERHRA